MIDDPTPDESEQPCLGPDGHAPNEVGASFAIARVPLRTFPRLLGEATQAITSEPCIGALTSGQHISSIFLIAQPPFPQATNAQIVIFKNLDGSTIERVQNFDGLMPTQVAYLAAGWRSLIAQDVTLRAGRPREITPESASRWGNAISDAVDRCHTDGVRVNYASASERMRPYAYRPDRFGEIVRELAGLGYGPWPSYFDRRE